MPARQLHAKILRICRVPRSEVVHLGKQVPQELRQLLVVAFWQSWSCAGHADGAAVTRGKGQGSQVKHGLPSTITLHSTAHHQALGLQKQLEQDRSEARCQLWYLEFVFAALRLQSCCALPRSGLRFSGVGPRASSAGEEEGVCAFRCFALEPSNWNGPLFPAVEPHL